jgi:hypothetical protein
MLDLLRRIRLRGKCRLELSRRTVSVQRTGLSGLTAKSAKAAGSIALLVERPIPDPRAAGSGVADALAAQIAAALEQADAKGLPVHATLGDELVRYFIVTPPGNSARMQDLRAATAVRFQVLYGEAASAWQLEADWRADTPFLACAVSRQIAYALQQAVAAQHACLVSVTPNFVAAWNRSRRQLSAGTWLATLGEGVLTLGLVADAARPRLAAVRALALPDTVPSMAWLCEQVARIALLDDLPAPSVLQIHGVPLDAWQGSAASTGDAGMAVRWCAPGHALRGPDGSRQPAMARLASRWRAA